MSIETAEARELIEALATAYDDVECTPEEFAGFLREEAVRYESTPETARSPHRTTVALEGHE